MRAAVYLFLLSALFVLTGCQTDPSGVPPTALGETVSPEIAVTPTSFQPPSPESEPTASPTPVPLALSVNGEPVTLDAFNLALQRFHQGLPEVPTEEAFDRVLGDYIDQILLSQAAEAEGYTMSEEDWAARLAALTEDAGGEAALSAWLEANLYPRDVFEQDLRRSAAAAWMRDRIYETVPLSMEQVRARQIRVNSRAEADEILAQLNGGTSFDIMIAIYDPEGLGDLGWFPRGVLFEPAVEEAAFSLSVGDYGSVVETSVGYHIVQVIDFAEDRPLDPDALYVLRLAALSDWLEARRAASDIQVFVP